MYFHWPPAEFSLRVTRILDNHRPESRWLALRTERDQKPVECVNVLVLVYVFGSASIFAPRSRNLLPPFQPSTLISYLRLSTPGRRLSIQQISSPQHASPEWVNLDTIEKGGITCKTRSKPASNQIDRVRFLQPRLIVFNIIRIIGNGGCTVS